MPIIVMAKLEQKGLRFQEAISVHSVFSGTAAEAAAWCFAKNTDPKNTKTSYWTRIVKETKPLKTGG